MSANRRGTEGEPRSPDARTAARRTPDAPALESTLVTYTDRPDRRTVYPPGLSSVARMSTWLTANEEAFASLEEMR